MSQKNESKGSKQVINSGGSDTILTGPNNIRNVIAYTEDFLNGAGTGSFTSTVSGTGAVATITASTTFVATNRWGILQLTNGTTTTGRASCQGAPLKLGGGETLLETSINFNGLSNATDEYSFDVGFHDAASTSATPVEGIWFQYDRLTSTNWICKNANGTSTTSTTTSTAVANSTWIDLKIIVSAANSSVSFYINGSLVATHTTNISTGTGVIKPVYRNIKSAGTTATSCYSDYFNYSITLNTPRG